MIKHGGTINGQGLGMFEHLMAARQLAWPLRYRHEWTDLLYRNFIENDITIMMGAVSTGKTSHASEYVVLKYLASPYDTLVILSTIDMDKLDTGVWAEVKMLWGQCQERFPNIAGNIIDHRRCIATHNLDDGDVRDLRCGILSRPCYVGGKWVGLGKLAGIKQRNVIYLADELQHMAETYIESWPAIFANQNSGGRTQIIGSGNPNGDADDQLGLSAQPKNGWPSIGEPNETTVWETVNMGGKCVNLVGIDSPNFRNAKKGISLRYPGLIGPDYAKRIIHDYGENSHKYYKNVKGVMKVGMVSDRVITRQICQDHHAHDKAVWATGPKKKVHGLDPSYSADGDDCISYILEWGQDVSGKEVLRCVTEVMHRFDLACGISVEDQIAGQVQTLLKDHGISPENSFYDPYGKGTIGFAFSRKFGSNCPIPVDSGGKPTERPVREGLYVDTPNGGKRLKKCSEHYSKFVSEAWFSVRYVIESGQMREFPEGCMKEMCARKYSDVAGDKIEVEPKAKLKERTGKSPNKGDAFAIALEGARQRGFKIGKLGESAEDDGADGFQWLSDRVRKHHDLIRSKQLTYA